MGLPQDYLESRNYCKEIKFYLSDNKFPDAFFIRSKKKIRMFLFIGAVFFIISFCEFFIGF